MNPNRITYRKIAQTCRGLLKDEARLTHHEMIEIFVRIMIEWGFEAAGIPVACQHVGNPGNTDSGGSVISRKTEEQVRHTLAMIPAEEWRIRPECAGWLYQYILEERKVTVFSELKKGRKAGAEDIPAVTQLFTPEWIARYMAENTVGRLWLKARPESSLAASWRYYDKDGASDKYVKGGGAGSRSCHPWDWKVLDPACGCGHLLAAAFDVLLDIYREAGIDDPTSAKLILERNLTGLDIDPLAVRISRFVLLMKAARVVPSITAESVAPRIVSVNEPGREELGSLLRQQDLDLSAEDHPLLDCTYDVVVTNPPYLGRRHMSGVLAAFLDERYPRSRNDLFAAFLERSLDFLRPGGYHAVINQHAWMFLSGYEELRRTLLAQSSILTMLHLGTRAFEEITGEVVQTVCFVVQKEPPGPDTSGVYWNLTEDALPGAKQSVYLERIKTRRSIVRQLDFMSLPGARISYRLPEPCKKLFREHPPVSSLYAVKKGMDTGGNEKYVRYWHEVPEHLLSFKAETSGEAVWFPYAKGGGFRKWYGNHYYVVYWTDGGRDIRSDPRSNLRNEAYYGRPGITWSTVSTERAAFRLLEPGFLFDNGGSCLFSHNVNQTDRYGMLAYLNSDFTYELLSQTNPTLNVQPGDVARLPVDETLLAEPEMTRLGKVCVDLARMDWDETEWSWSFRQHPMAVHGEHNGLLEAAYQSWNRNRTERGRRMQAAEAGINRLIRRHFGLEEDGAADRTAEPLLPTLQEDLHTLLSYAVGYLLGRYPPADGREFFEPLYLDRGHLIPRLEQWLAGIWGQDHVEANLNWIGRSLRTGKTERPVDRIIRYFQDEFYADHFRTYSKKPYYARLSSGEYKALYALVPIRKLGHPLLRSLLEFIEQRLDLESGMHRPSPNEAAELQVYAWRLRRFMEERPSEPDPNSCSRTLYQHYAPLFDS